MASTASTATPAARNGQGRRVTRRAHRADTAPDAWWSVSEAQLHAGDPQAVDTFAEQAEQCREQGDRDEHRHRYDQRDRVAESGDEGYADECQTQDRDQHGQPGEDDRLAGGGDGAGDSLVDGHPLGEVLAVTGHDEQRVVDADCDADHRCQDRREGGHLGEPAEDPDEQEPDAETDEGSEHRQRHGNNRPERNCEDHDGDAETDQLRGPGLLGSEAFHHGPAIGDVESCGEGGRIGRGERHDALGADLARGGVVGDLGEGDTPVVRYQERRRRPERVDHLGDTGKASNLVERSFDPRPKRGVGDLALFGGEHHPGPATGGFGKAFLEQVNRSLGLGARDLDALARRFAPPPSSSRGHQGGNHPQRDDRPRVAGAPAAEAVEGKGHGRSKKRQRSDTPARPPPSLDTASRHRL